MSMHVCRGGGAYSIQYDLITLPLLFVPFDILIFYLFYGLSSLVDFPLSTLGGFALSLTNIDSAFSLPLSSTCFSSPLDSICLGKKHNMAPLFRSDAYPPMPYQMISS